MIDAAKEIIFFDNPSKNKEVIAQIADIHIQTFGGFFLTFLGRGFLKQMYQGFAEHDNSGLIVAQCDGAIVGFLAYSEDLSAFYKYLIKKKLVPFAWFALGAAIRKPSAMVRLLRAFSKPSESKREEQYIELSSIGVLPRMKNCHIGSRLIDELKKRFNGERFSYIKLETDAENNDGANAFYIKNDFVLCSAYETNEGRKMNEYRWSR